jgi:hypothetical protein
MPAGGRREGAGHPTNAQVRERKAAQARDTATFTRKAVAALGHNFEKLQELADGIYVEQTTEDGTRRVYKKAPDRQAIMFLVEHGRGKAAQAVAVQQETTINIVSHVPRPQAVAPIPKEAEAPDEESEAQ